MGTYGGRRSATDAELSDGAGDVGNACDAPVRSVGLNLFAEARARYRDELLVRPASCLFGGRRDTVLSVAALGGSVKRGLEVGLYLRDGVTDPDSIALELGNLAAFELASEREELLLAQVFRVTVGRSHHYRIALRHPSRRISRGLSAALARKLEELSNEPEGRLHRRFVVAQRHGLRPSRLRRIREPADFWQDELWTAFGGPASIGLSSDPG